MKPVTLSAGRTKLYTALKTLRLHWDEVEAVWKDSVRQDFEQNYWMPLDPPTLGVLMGMDRLDQVLAQVQHECGSEDDG